MTIFTVPANIWQFDNEGIVTYVRFVKWCDDGDVRIVVFDQYDNETYTEDPSNPAEGNDFEVRKAFYADILPHIEDK